MEQNIWGRDSECCSKCGALLDYGEVDICWFCLQNELDNDDAAQSWQDFYDSQWSDEEVGKS